MEFRRLIQDKIQENETVSAYKTKLAKAAKCQLSYLLQVLKGQARLSLDQAYDLCLFWELTPEEIDLYMTINCLDKAKTPGLRTYYLEKIREMLKNMDKPLDFDTP